MDGLLHSVSIAAYRIRGPTNNPLGALVRKRGASGYQYTFFKLLGWTTEFPRWDLYGYGIIYSDIGIFTVLFRDTPESQRGYRKHAYMYQRHS